MEASVRENAGNAVHADFAADALLQFVEEIGRQGHAVILMPIGEEIEGKCVYCSPYEPVNAVQPVRAALPAKSKKKRR